MSLAKHASFVFERFIAETIKQAKLQEFKSILCFPWAGNRAYPRKHISVLSRETTNLTQI